MDKKLVICDIDNTLVEKHGELSTRAKAVIENLQKHHVYFGIASGRSIEQIKRMIQGWGYDDMDILIGLNGSVLWDGTEKKQHEYFIMKKKWIKEVIELMEPFSENIVMYQNDTLLCEKMDDMVEISSKSSDMKAIQVSSLAEFYTEDNAKIMFRTTEENMLKAEAFFASRSNDPYRAFKTQSTLMEFSDRRVSKAYTLQKFCEMHDISMKEVIAFGDTSNDNDMLEASGIGVCLSNGSDDTKAIADEITELPCDQDGWADYMEHHFLKPRGW